ncbi:hypothetical protein BJ875DRAFT_454144 [Amylocarpus encephaloides]|uniref:Uncharacterized protein n=1 Tax=Amylocarpus encephaloides TaxID=45428 RepID=A0A9P8C8F9_9HELO|nr:hypothetical protein BJ875DRAFT_454144 [Amylocarpus encephaloides]
MTRDPRPYYAHVIFPRRVGTNPPPSTYTSKTGSKRLPSRCVLLGTATRTAQQIIPFCLPTFIHRILPSPKAVVTMDCRVTLDNELRSFENELIEVEIRNWVPVLAIKELVKDTVVVGILKEASMESAGATSWTKTQIEELTEFVLKKAQRLFALLVMNDMVRLLDLFYSNDFGDDMFPIEQLRLDNGRETVNRSKPERTIQSIQTQKKISYTDQGIYGDKIRNLCIYWQWEIFVPIFSSNNSVYALRPLSNLPFLKKYQGDKKTETNFSIISHVSIHRSHLDFPDSQIGDITDDKGNPHVAVKELTSARGLTWWYG